MDLYVSVDGGLEFVYAAVAVPYKLSLSVLTVTISNTPSMSCKFSTSGFSLSCVLTVNEVLLFMQHGTWHN